MTQITTYWYTKIVT